MHEKACNSGFQVLLWSMSLIYILKSTYFAKNLLLAVVLEWDKVKKQFCSLLNIWIESVAHKSTIIPSECSLYFYYFVRFLISIIKWFFSIHVKLHTDNFQSFQNLLSPSTRHKIKQFNMLATGILTWTTLH